MTYEAVVLPGFEEVDRRAWELVRKGHRGRPQWDRRVHILPENELFVVVGESLVDGTLVQDRVWVALGRIARREHCEIALAHAVEVAGDPPVLAYRDPVTGAIDHLAISLPAARAFERAQAGQPGATRDLA